MASLDYDSRQSRAPLRRPPPVVISEPELDSPGAAARRTGAVVPSGAGHMVLALGPTTALGAVPRLAPAVAAPLAALAGPANRQPLLYSGDAAGSLDALRQDVVVSYRAICSVLGEPDRTDLSGGGLPAAAALGLPLPSAPCGPVAPRLPPLAGGAGPLLLMPPPPPPAASAAAGRVGQPTPAAAPGQAGGVTMGLGPSVGIEGVGSGAETPARLIAAAGSMSAAGGRLAPGFSGQSGIPVLGALRSLSAGHAVNTAAAGLPRPGLGRGGADRNWPLGRPSAAGGAAAGSAALSGGGGGPRIAMMSGFSRPQDPSSDFLGEESAVVYPPPGRTFSGGASVAARAALGGHGLAQDPGLAIDAMADFQFRGGGRKHIRIEDLDDPSRLIPRFRRDDEGQLELFLKEYARDRPAKPKAEPVGGRSRYRMPF